MKKNQSKKDVFSAKTKLIDIEQGEGLAVLLNEHEARKHGINSLDKVEVIYDGHTFVADVDLSNGIVGIGEIGILKDVAKKYKIKKDQLVSISFSQTNPLSIEALKKGIKGVRLNPQEIHAIMKDISENRFTDILTTYFSAIGFFYQAKDEDLYYMAKAMAETGETLHFPGLVADKHCMGGVPGNETTMIMIPLLASLGIKMPKSFSKAITTPAATGECVSVLMDISFSKKQIEDLIKKNNTCLVRGGGLDLAPADEKLIKVAYPLSMQSFSRTIVSIMAKKYAMGINHLLLDIPVGPTAKVVDIKTAKWLKQKYEYVGRRLGMKMCVELTPALQPIGAGVGAVMQVREVLRILQQHPARPSDLEEKAVYLSSKIIELVGIAKGKEAYKLAYGQLVSGKAREMMKKIIKAQNGNPNVKSEELKLAKIKHEVKSHKNGNIKDIDMKTLNSVARTLGAPIDLQAGLYLSKKIGDSVKKGETIYTLYANDDGKIRLALELLDQKKIYKI